MRCMMKSLLGIGLNEIGLRKVGFPKLVGLIRVGQIRHGMVTLGVVKDGISHGTPVLKVVLKPISMKRPKEVRLAV